MQNDAVAAALESLIRDVGNIHVWSASGKLTSAGYSLGDSQSVTLVKYWNGTLTTQYSDSVDVDDAGAISLADPVSSVGIDYYSDNVKDNASKLLGKFGTPPNSSTVYYFPEGQTPFVGYSSSLDDSIVSLNGKPLLGYPATYGTGYVTDVDSSTYPEDGTANDAIYRYCGTIAAGTTRIETGAYAGTGTYGSANPTTLTFGFVPELLIIFGGSTTDGYWYNSQFSNQKIGCPRLLTTSYVQGALFPGNGNGSYTYLWAKREDKTVSWYANSASYQANASGTTYSYLAIG